MKLLKLTDLIIQILITVVCITLGLIKDEMQILPYFYLILGGWQLLSFTTHSLFSTSWANWLERKNYGLTVLWAAVLGVINYLLMLADVPLVFFYLLAMLVVSPILACWYFIIGLSEWRTIRHRELIHLK